MQKPVQNNVLINTHPELGKIRRGGTIPSADRKRAAVIELCASDGYASTSVSDSFGISRHHTYMPERQVPGKDAIPDIRRNRLKITGTDDAESLRKELADLQDKAFRLKLEKDILEGTVAILKKGKDTDPKHLTAGEKAELIGVLRKKCKLTTLLDAFSIARSTCCYQASAIAKPFRHEELSTRIRTIFEDNHSRYGYRRIQGVLNHEGFTVSEKVVLRLMSEAGLHVLCKRQRKYNSYKGEISADVPNEKWLSDITEFSIPAGKAYFSPIVDCFDGMIVSWTIGTSPDAKMVNAMLEGAICTLSPDEHPVVHTDRGCHYRWPGWIERMEAAKLVRSMSGKGCSPDNSACEGLFGRMKNEMFYGRKWFGASLERLMDIINEYVVWYNEKRIKESLGFLSPRDYREKLGVA